MNRDEGSYQSFTRPEAHNVFYCRHRRTETRSRTTRRENFLKVGRVIFKIRERTDRHTDTLVAILRTPTGARTNHGFDENLR